MAITKLIWKTNHAGTGDSSIAHSLPSENQLSRAEGIEVSLHSTIQGAKAGCQLDVVFEEHACNDYEWQLVAPYREVALYDAAARRAHRSATHTSIRYGKRFEQLVVQV